MLFLRYCLVFAGVCKLLYSVNGSC